MTDNDIGARARFDIIRYAQLWEDADILVRALATPPGATLVSICSAGDNALAMLTLDPAQVIVADLSQAQIEALRIRIAAYERLSHDKFLALMGSRASSDRGALFEALMPALPRASRAFWRDKRADVIAHGLGGIGKFERYFRIFRKYFLPLVHSRRTLDAIFAPRSEPARKEFLASTWNSLRWRILLNVFFSRFVMGRLGRDPAFFDHVEKSITQHVTQRIEHAFVSLDPVQNPYLHWIMRGTHGNALPFAWRACHYETIRNRLSRLDIRHGSLDQVLNPKERIDGLNLSDIFEYMDTDTATRVYERLLAVANPRARFVYWNMLVPRRVPASLAHRVARQKALEDQLKAQDKAFFYSDFVIEEVHP